MKLLTVRIGKRRLAAALAAIAVVTAALLVTGQGYPTSRVRMYPGTVWLTSSQVGQATLVDGATGQVATKVEVAAPGTPLGIAQHHNAAYVLNRTTGALVRIDGATERISPPAPLLPATQVLLAPHTLYAVNTHNGMVTSADPETLAPRDPPQQLTASDSLVVDSSSRLWTVDPQTGDLVWLNGRQRQTRPATPSRLTLTAGQPVLVDPARSTAELLDPNTGTVTRSVTPDIRPGENIALSGSPDRARLLLAVSTHGTFTTCTFDTDSCTMPITIGSPSN